MSERIALHPVRAEIFQGKCGEEWDDVTRNWVANWRKLDRPEPCTLLAYDHSDGKVLVLTENGIWPVDCMAIRLPSLGGLDWSLSGTDSTPCREGS